MFRKVLSLVVIVTTVAAVPISDAIHPEQHHIPKPYKFGYAVKDAHGAVQHRDETGDGLGGVKGSYGYTDANGLHRQVDYVADHGGFRAHVKTNEPGTANLNPADVTVMSSADHASSVAHSALYAPLRMHGDDVHGYGYGYDAVDRYLI